MSPFKSLLVSTVALAAVCAAPLAAAAQARPAAQPRAAAPARADAAPVWAHSASDLQPQEGVRFGRLDNGMRYVIMRNGTPSGQASLRLRFNTGSMNETEEQLGYAHFLEHMAFNGSTNVPEGQMIQILERAGLSFGADTNASTGFDETIYKLDLPRTDAQTVDTSLMLFREVASEITNDPAAVDRERGIVLSEERTRATPAYRNAIEGLRFMLQGQRAADRVPIGTVESLRSPNAAAQIRSYYRAYYRPENAVLVAVGDFDIDEMERKIRERFASWRPQGAAGAQAPVGAVAQRGRTVELFAEPGVSTAVQITWTRAPDLRTETRAVRREDTLRYLALQVLNRRLERIARGDEPPFISGSAASSTIFRSADLTQLTATLTPARWRDGLTALVQEQRRLQHFGVTQAELDREITETRTQLQQAAAAAATRRTPQLADAIVGTLGDDDVFTSPQTDLEEFQRNVDGLTAAAVNAVVPAMFSGSGPLIYMSSPTPLEGGEAAVTQAFDAAASATVTAAAEQAAVAWPYESFGTPGAVAERREIADLNTTFVRFANGVRLTVRPSQLRQDEVLVSVRVGDGTLAQPTDRFDVTWAAPLAFPQGGLRDLTADQVEQALASVTYGASFGVGDDAFVFGGRTRPQDFQRQMQVLAAYVAYPGWRPQGMARMQAFAPAIQDQLATSPAGVLQRDLSQLLHGGDPRFGTPTLQQMQSTRLEDLRALLDPAFRSGEIEVVVTGDVTVDEAIRQTAATFGALPQRQAGVGADAPGRRVSFPAAVSEPVRLTHRGRADQGAAFVAWKTTDFPSDPQGARVLRLLQQVMQLRLIEEIREGQGVTYSPSSSLESSWDFPGYGYLAASIQAPPDKLADFLNDAERIAAALRETPVTADELARARNPWLEARQRALQGNEYWLAALADAQTEPGRLAAIREQIEGLRRVTPAELQAAARRYLAPDRRWSVVVVPEAGAAPAQAAAVQAGATPPAPAGR